MKIYIVKRTEYRPDGTIEKVENLECYDNQAAAYKSMDEYREDIGDDEKVVLDYKEDFGYSFAIYQELGMPGNPFAGSGKFALSQRYVVEPVHVGK